MFLNKKRLEGLFNINNPSKRMKNSLQRYKEYNIKMGNDINKDLKISQINYYYNEDSNAWILSSKTDFIYNADNLVINENIYYYNSHGLNEYLGSQTTNIYPFNHF